MATSCPRLASLFAYSYVTLKPPTGRRAKHGRTNVIVNRPPPRSHSRGVCSPHSRTVREIPFECEQPHFDQGPAEPGDDDDDKRIGEGIDDDRRPRGFSGLRKVNRREPEGPRRGFGRQVIEVHAI